MAAAVTSANQPRSSYRWYLLIAFLLCLLLISRNDSRLFHPTLWAEDGRPWTTDAYETGLRSLLRPHTGYFQTFPRLVALTGLHVSLRLLPAWAAWASLIMQMAPVWVLLRRGQTLIPSPLARFALMIFYIGMPNSQELYITLTDAQWHFGLLIFLLLLLPPPATRWGRGLQYGVLALGGVSGPFSVFLVPVAAWKAWRPDPGAERHARIQCGIVTLTALIQLGALLYQTFDQSVGRNNHDHATPLGASLPALLRILSNQIFLPSVGGVNWLNNWRGLPHWPEMTLAWLTFLIGAGAMILAWRCNKHWRFFAYFTLVIFAISLASPVVTFDEPEWRAMANPGIGCRYYFFPLLLWFTAVLALTAHSYRPLRLAARALLPLFLLGMIADWTMPPTSRAVEKGYAAAVKICARTAPGQLCTFPEEPGSWNFSFIKH